MMFFPFLINCGKSSLQHEVDDDVDDDANLGQCSGNFRNQCLPSLWLVGL
jgi:hypothetical protein